MLQTAGLMVSLVGALAGGVWLSVVAIAGAERVASVTAGAWTFSPSAGAYDADPYTRARTARLGALPMALGEGVALAAAIDSDGRPLDGACLYRLAGAAPNARFATIAVHTPEGGLFDNPAGRHVLTQREMIYTPDGGWDVALAPDPPGGNWLPTPRGAPFVVVVRLYDTPLSAIASGLTADALPRLARIACPADADAS